MGIVILKNFLPIFFQKGLNISLSTLLQSAEDFDFFGF